MSRYRDNVLFISKIEDSLNTKYHKKHEIVNRFEYKEDRYKYTEIVIHSKVYIEHTGEVIV